MNFPCLIGEGLREAPPKGARPRRGFVHHRNGNHQDNALANLVLLPSRPSARSLP
ncbi:MAG: HNH endonuclease [Chloroflexi bacterium]|nr:HNH endonuclease [Chloroflexota bacterium]